MFDSYYIPIEFFENKKYVNTLSSSAKLMYSLLNHLNDMALSQGWIDEQGRKYISVGNEYLAEKLGVSHTVVIKNKRELEDIGLIVQIKLGQTQFNRIYLQ